MAACPNPEILGTLRSVVNLPAALGRCLELLGTEGLGLSISMMFSREAAILATLGTAGWRGIFYQGSFPLPKEAQSAR